MNDIRMMKPLSLFIIILLFVSSCAYEQAVNADTLCGIDSLPSIHFDGTSDRLDGKAMKSLDSIATLLNINKGCAVTVGVWSVVGTDQSSGRLTWQRTKDIIDYLVRRNVGDDRLWFANVLDAGLNYIKLKPSVKNSIPAQQFRTTPWQLLNDTYATASADVDGDGIPGYLDFDKLTPKECFPVNADGVGARAEVQLVCLKQDTVHWHDTMPQLRKILYKNTTAAYALKDSDGDGITDQFDLEPNTPPNAEVDTHGHAVDTDGDGVPDYRDREKLTLLPCFPVNSEGVGTCPEPSCCIALSHWLNRTCCSPAPPCDIDSFPSINFAKGAARLNKASVAALQKIGETLRNHAQCNIKLSALSINNAKAKQLARDRINVIFVYLVEKQGIAEARIIFDYHNDGTAEIIKLEPTTEPGVGNSTRP